MATGGKRKKKKTQEKNVCRWHRRERKKRKDIKALSTSQHERCFQSVSEGWAVLCRDFEGELLGCRTGGPDNPKDQERGDPSDPEKRGRCHGL